jgi:anti-sigma factor RsiW
MSCSEVQSALSELVDGTLPRDRRSLVESHLDSCADCRAIADDIRRIRQQARALPKMTPPAALWDKVRADFQAAHRHAGAPSDEVDRPLHPERPARPADVQRKDTARILGFIPRSRTSLVAGLAAAAALVLATSATVYYATRPAAPGPHTEPTAAHPGPVETVQSIEAELELAEQHYSRAIAGLEKVAQDGQGVLDEQTAAVLAKNNAILDQAINDSRAALKTQPSSEVARASLFEALQRKVALLRDTISLINEMRKGDQGGTARVVGNLGKG